jgi:hypothetical protein
MAKYTAPITADTLVRTGGGTLYGYIVSSHTSGTIKAWDSTAANFDVIHDTWTLAAGPQVITFPKGIDFYTGLFIDVGGTISLTPIWEPNS